VAEGRRAVRAGTERVIEGHGSVADIRRVIRIEVGSPAEGFDLRESLARRGIQAALVESDGAWEVQVTSPREEPDRLLHDVSVGVESWRLGRRGTPSLLP
jgi:hypothetical protein